jgi:hypothetical protein
MGNRKSGGAISGPGGPSDDAAGLYRLSPGEAVWSAADVEAMGGRDAIYAFRDALKRSPEPPPAPGHIVLEDVHGNRVTVTEAHWRRWMAALSQTFRPVAETPDTTVSIEPPTGDKTEEN